jgi:hypothetical protein
MGQARALVCPILVTPPMAILVASMPAALEIPSCYLTTAPNIRSTEK